MSAAAKTPATPEATQSGYDPVALAQSLAAAADKSAKLIGDFAAHHAKSGASLVTDELGIGKAFMEMASKMLANPYKLAETQMNLWWDYMNLWQASTMRLMGGSAEPVAAPKQGDKRFRHEDWEEHFLFDYIKQGYLITARWLHETVASVEGLDEGTKKKVDFFTRQYIDALAPSNFALTNPEVFRETIASGGQNLVRGLNNLLDDIERGNGRLKISMTDTKAFELGVNIATTPGKVVFQNDLMQLIQYEPSTKKVATRPLLVIPPWINKYYIMDLREKNSLIKWTVDQGITVFVISWVNPDEKLAHKDFEDYLQEGPLAALDAIEKGDRRSRGQRARLLPRRDAPRRDARVHGGEEGQADRQRDVHDGAHRLQPVGRARSVHRREPGLLARAQDDRARLSRRQRDGNDVQHAARERPDLVVRDQQLPDGPRSLPVRPPALESGRDADAGDDAQLLPAQHVHE